MLGGGDKSVVAYIFVNPVELESQTVTTKPLLVYSQDGKLDLSSTKVTAKYANGAVKIWGYDTERVIFRLDGNIVKNGASLDKSQHNGKDLTIYYGGETVTLGRLTVNSTAATPSPCPRTAACPMQMGSGLHLPTTPPA